MAKGDLFAKAVPAWVLVVLLIVSLVLPVAVPRIALAAGEGIESSDIQTLPGNDISLSSLQVSGTGNDHVSLRVEVTDGYFWFYNTVDTDIDWDEDEDDRVFTISGLREDVNATLAELYFEGGQDLYTVTATLVDGNYNPGNYHVYQVVEDAGISWEDAKIAAEGMTNGGVNGYLATITSVEEHNFIRERINDSGWIGASDAGDEVEGEWRWVTGPEGELDGGDGLLFWEDGELVAPQYANWNDGEPNNSTVNNEDGEDCGQIWFNDGSDGQWNDLACDSEENEYYVVEFGAPGALPAVVLDTFTIDTRGDDSVIQVSNCDQLFALGAEHITNTIELTADIDCQGRTEAPLFDEEDFYGVFEGNGFTIKNLVIANEDGEHVGLTGYSVGAEYRNIFLDNITVNGDYHNGVLAGHVDESIIAENIHATNITMNSLPGEEYVEEMGVLFGTLETNHEYGESRIEHVSVQGTFTMSDVEYVSGVGGIAGYMEVEGDFVIKQAYADVDIVTNNVADYSRNVGGLVGYWDIDGEDDNEDKDVVQGIENSYTWGSISSPNGSDVGGLVGNIDNDNEDDADMTFVVSDSYSWMDIDALNRVGGLVGSVDDIDDEDGAYSYEFTNSFYAGMLNGDTNSGIIIGLFEGYEDEIASLTFDNVWYDAAKVAGYDCVSNADMDECNAANVGNSQPNYFIDNKANAPMDEWDFATIWRTNAGTPPVFKPFIGNDGDQDDVNDYIESRAPNGGDANNDGIQDSEQANVSSFRGSVLGKYISVAVDDECSLSRVGTKDEQENVVRDTGYSYPAGLVNFTADCGTPGYTTSVNLYFYDVDSNLTVRKYNPETGSYFTVTSATKSAQVIGGEPVAVVSYEITDGGQLDVDSVANGVIIDPVGLAQAGVGAPNTGFGRR